MTERGAVWISAILVAACVWGSAAAAQSVIQQGPLTPAPPPAARPAPPAAAGMPATQPPPSAQPKQPQRPPQTSGQVPAGAESPRGGDSALRARIEQLEEQVIDLQVAIGTLESLAKGSSATAPAGGFRTAPTVGAAGAGDLEVQVRAVVSQLERLSERVQALETGRGAAPASAAITPTPPPAARAPAATRVVPDAGFGQTVVTPGGSAGGDAIGGLLRDPDAGAPPPGGRQTAAVDPSVGGNPKQLYETAYGHLLQQDYGAAEAAFTDFLGQYPNDALAGNAQYWLGETYFVRGQFKAAAGAFLKGYQTYARSSKAPDSLLKLAMSLDRLGQRDAACTSFGELQTRFPQAPASIRSRAQSERQRLGC